MSTCQRLWEVEAARDGRITGGDRVRVERHVASCADCEREQRKLAALGKQLRAIQVEGADELSLRRRRHELLSLANAERLAPTSFAPRARLRTALVAGTALVALGTGGWFWHAGSRRPPTLELTAQPPSASRLVVKADPGALFQEHIEGGRTIVNLEHGRLTLIVRRDAKNHGVLVRTPDGEIEDVGTTFAVSVSGGRTEAVQVFEGRVFVRIAGHERRTLQAGEVYRPEPPASRPVATPSASVSHMRKDRGASSHERRRSHPAARAEKEAPPSDLPEATPAEEFAEAFSAFEAGEMSRAAALFFQFEARHRDDLRAEDAAYLRLVALIRGGRDQEANYAARTYLQRYPNGFRAQDVERMLTP